MGCLCGLENISPCVMDNEASVVVWQRDLHLVDSLEESDEAGAWSLMSAYAKLGLGCVGSDVGGRVLSEGTTQCLPSFEAEAVSSCKPYDGDGCCASEESCLFGCWEQC